MNKEDLITSYDFSILHEDASSQDLFEDKTHQRVSNNLYKLIDNSPKGITIGLEGSWGSGKSTVINILKEQLNSTHQGKRLFFMFDAWAHDGDPLRRIFLESLIREIDPNGENSELNEIKGKITGRKKTIEIKAKKSTSRLGKLISLSALLIPLGSSFLSKVDYSQVVAPWSDNNGPYYTLILGLLLCLSPLIVLIYWFFRGDKNPINNNVSWEFFTVDTTENYTQDITEDGERTSIEFEDFFKEIISISIKRKLIEKIIIVIDNLDRVTPEHAKNVWSTLQTFFQRRSTTNTLETWPNQVWFIVPFDRDGFKKIWQSKDEESKISDSFIKKCFQLIAEVPHPVMSGWSLYVEKCIDVALEKWPLDEKLKVVSTYIRYASHLDKSPTPRDIRVFVNQVGLLGSMWGGQTSAEAMCLYILFKGKISTDELRRLLVLNELPDDFQPDLERSVLLPQIAGLLFGVNAHKGLQLLLGPEIHAAFKAGDGDALLKLSEYHGNAFWIAYESSRDLWRITVGSPDEYKVTFTKALHNGLSGCKHRLKRDIDILRTTWITSYTSLDFSSDSYSESLRYTFNLCDDNTFIEAINRLTSEKLAQEVAKINSDKFSIQSIGNLIPSIDFLKEYNYPIRRMIYNVLNHTNWRLWLEQLNNNNISLDIVLPKAQTITELATGSQFSSTSVDSEELQCLIQTYELYNDSSEWEGVADQVISWLNRPDREWDCELVYKLALELAVHKNNKIKSSILKCVKGSAFWNAGVHASISINPSLPILAALSFKHEIQNNHYLSSEVKSFWNNTDDKKSLEHIYSTLKKIDSLDVLWLLCRDSANKTAIEIVKTITTPELYSQENGVTFIDEFEWADDDDLSSISLNLVKHGAFSKNHSAMENEAVIYHKVYEIFYKSNDKDTLAFIDSSVNKVTQEQWYDAIENNNSLTLLARDKNPHFSDALCNYLTKVVQGDLDSSRNWDFSIISTLLTKVADLDKTVLPKIIKSYFSSSQDYLSDSEFNIMSPYFSPHIDNVDDILIMERINFWIDKEKNERIEWFISQEISLSEQPLESLMSRIELCLTSGNDIKISLMKRLCVKLKLKFRSIEDRDNIEEIVE
ncbi:P-loop NTPase fold protein [Aeromonas caviae]